MKMSKPFAPLDQGVHELWDLQPGAPWKKGETRVSKIIFIGRNLDRAELKQEVEGWVVGTDRQRLFRDALEEMWAEEDEDYIEAVQAYAPQIGTLEYEVTHTRTRTNTHKHTQTHTYTSTTTHMFTPSSARRKPAVQSIC